MKSKEGMLKLNFMGGLAKFGPKNSSVRKFEIKTIPDDNDSEIDLFAGAFGRWASYGIIPELANFDEKIPTANVPWKISIPLADKGIFVDIDFGHNIPANVPGTCFKAQLINIAFSVKKGCREAVMSFIKNGEPSDNDIQELYFGIKEERKGKMLPKRFNIIIDECESFTIGNAPVNDEGGHSDDDDDEGGLEPVVYPATR